MRRVGRKTERQKGGERGGVDGCRKKEKGVGKWRVRLWLWQGRREEERTF